MERVPNPGVSDTARVDSRITSVSRSFAPRRRFAVWGGTFPLSGYKLAKIGGVFALIVVTWLLAGNFGGVTVLILRLLPVST